MSLQGAPGPGVRQPVRPASTLEPYGFDDTGFDALPYDPDPDEVRDEDELQFEPHRHRPLRRPSTPYLQRPHARTPSPSTLPRLTPDRANERVQVFGPDSLSLSTPANSVDVLVRESSSRTDARGQPRHRAARRVQRDAGEDAAEAPHHSLHRASVSRARASYAKGARFLPVSFNSKLGRVEQPIRPNGGKGLVAAAPFVAVTDASISATCSSACPFKDAGCYQQAGRSRQVAAQLDEAATGSTADEVMMAEADLIDGSFRRGPVPQDGARGGRDLRLHVGGDVGSGRGAELLAGAADRWHARGGGVVWTFTHAWRDIPRAAFGRISVLASVEVAQDIEVARRAGYASAIVVGEFPSDKAFALPETMAKVIPCPAETRSTTCVECRLCLNADSLLKRNQAIGFAAHGGGARQVRQTLAQLRTSRQVAGQTRDKSHEASPCSSFSPVGAP